MNNLDRIQEIKEALSAKALVWEEISPDAGARFFGYEPVFEIENGEKVAHYLKPVIEKYFSGEVDESLAGVPLTKELLTQLVPDEADRNLIVYNLEDTLRQIMWQLTYQLDKVNGSVEHIQQDGGLRVVHTEVDDVRRVEPLIEAREEIVEFEHLRHGQLSAKKTIELAKVLIPKSCLLNGGEAIPQYGVDPDVFMPEDLVAVLEIIKVG